MSNDEKAVAEVTLELIDKARAPGSYREEVYRTYKGGDCVGHAGCLAIRQRPKGPVVVIPWWRIRRVTVEDL